MTKVFLIATCFFLCRAAIAQQYVNQVFILNEGRYDYFNNVQDVPVTVGSYSPATSVYTEFDEILDARFASDLIVYDNEVFVAADSFLIRYDLNSLERLQEVVVPGIRKLAAADGKLVATVADYLNPLDAYVKVFDASNFNLLYDIPNDPSGIEHFTSDVLIMNNKAYIAVNNGFSFPFAPVGYIAILDLATGQLTGEIDLGANGLNPENLMTNGSEIFTLNNNDYSTSSVSTIDLQQLQAATTSLALVSGCGTSAAFGDDVFYQAMYDPNEITSKNLGRFSTNAQTTIDTLFLNRTIYGMATEPVNNLLYVAETDFVTYGLILVYDESGNLHDAFAASVSPGTIAFDLRTASAISATSTANQSLIVAPNPASEYITIANTNTAAGNWQLRVTNLLGSQVYSESGHGNGNAFHRQLSLEQWPSGIYQVEWQQGELRLTGKMVKQ